VSLPVTALSGLGAVPVQPGNQRKDNLALEVRPGLQDFLPGGEVLEHEGIAVPVFYGECFHQGFGFTPVLRRDFTLEKS